MGGHGGLNILPQKSWNVYNFDNREKVRRDEEEAARQEQLKREQSRKRDAEFRLERLRTARGLAPLVQPHESDPSEPKPADSGHINLFEGIKIFDPIRESSKDGAAERDASKKVKKMNKEGGKPTTVMGPEDEKYRLGYGVAGKGVQLPWYLQKRNDNDDHDDDVDGDGSGGDRGNQKGEKKRKSLEELREERLKREKREKEREMTLRKEKRQSHRDAHGSRRFSRR